MNTKQKIIGSSLLLVGAGSLIALGLTLKDYLDTKKEEQLKDTIRDYFSSMGEIAVLYINAFESDEDVTTGGVVMTDDRVYQFIYRCGEIDYTKEDL
ncbi:DUF4651 domain-containing protein [Streptococcus dentiloxodontae]